VSWSQASQGFWVTLRAAAATNDAPLHNILLHFTILFLGDGEFALRLPSVVLGVAGVAAIYWVGSLIDGPPVGYLSAALLGLSTFHIYYSQEARDYALLALTATLFAGATIRALGSDRRGWHGASTVAAILLLYSHPYGLFLWFSIAIAVIASARLRRDPDQTTLARWAIWQAVPILVYLPWAGFLASRYVEIAIHGFWIRKPDAHALISIVVSLASGRLMALMLAAGAVLGLFAPARPLEGSAEGPLPAKGHFDLLRVVLLAWPFGPLLLGLTVSLISQPILWDRYLICSLPGWLILASWGFCRLGRIWGSWVLAAVVAAALGNLYYYEPHHRDDVRGAVAAYVGQAVSADCVFMYRDYLAVPVLYYLREPPPCFRPSKTAADIRPWEFASPRAWLFLGFINADERRAVMDSLQAHGWQTHTVTKVPGVELLVAESAKPNREASVAREAARKVQCLAPLNREGVGEGRTPGFLSRRRTRSAKWPSAESGQVALAEGGASAAQWAGSPPC